MTTIVMVKTPWGVDAAWDRQATQGENNSIVTLQDKVFKNGPYVIGVAGTLKGLQVLQTAVLPTPKKGQDPFAFVLRELIPALRAELEKYGHEPNENGFHELDVVIGFNGDMYDVSGLDAVIQRADGHYIMGSGSAIALGAMDVGATPKRAVEAAANHDTYTGLDVAEGTFPW